MPPTKKALSASTVFSSLEARVADLEDNPAGEWGGIAGTITSQSDLMSQLNAKVATANLATVNGQPLDTPGDIEASIVTNNVTTSGGNMTALSAAPYSGDLEDALADIGAAEATLLHDTDYTAATAIVVPANVHLIFTNGSKITKSGSGTIEFEGDPFRGETPTAEMFSGFSPGDITFTGTDYPRVIATSLWANALLSDKLKNAIGSIADKPVTIKAYPGTLSGTHFTITAKKKIWFTHGEYPNTMDDPMVPLIRFEDNVEICGDGEGQTIIHESSEPLNVRLFYAAAASTNPFEGLTQNANIHDLTIQGSPTQAVDSGASSILMGNCVNGHVYRVTFLDTHGFHAYFGQFGTAGYTADGWSITHCLVRGARTQSMGGISGKNGLVAFNKILDIQPDPTAPFGAMMDFEPNESGEYQENLAVIGNLFDGRGAQQGWSGIVFQAVDVPNGKNNIIADNVCIGADTQSLDFLPANVNTGANTITILDHKILPGQKMVYLGGGTDLSPLVNGTIYWITPIDNDTVKTSSSFANYESGTFIDLTTQGVGMHSFTSYSHMANAVLVVGGLDTTISGNRSIGATQGALSLSNSSNLNVHDNVSIRSGGGGDPAMRLSGVANSRFNRNVFTNGDVGLSQSTTITESEASWLVSTNGTTVTHLTPNAFRPFWKGKTATINAVDYVVARIIDNYTMELTATAGTQTGVTLTTKFLSNTYSDNEAELITLGGQSEILSTAFDRKITNVADVNHTIAANAGIIVYTTLTASRTATLPTAVGCKGKEFTIKDASGNATTFDIVIEGNGSETIDGAANIVIDASWGLKRVKSNGANWITV